MYLNTKYLIDTRYIRNNLMGPACGAFHCGSVEESTQSNFFFRLSETHFRFYTTKYYTVKRNKGAQRQNG